MGAEPIGSFGRYPDKTFPVPAAVKAQAKLGLELIKKHGKPDYLERTKVGRHRARQLMTGKPKVTLRDIVYIRSYLRRHAKDVAGVPLNKSKPTNGWMSWLIWGGNPAKPWVEGIYKRHKKEIEMARSSWSEIDDAENQCGCGEHDDADLWEGTSVGEDSSPSSQGVTYAEMDPSSVFEPYNGAKGLLVRVAVLPVHPEAPRPEVEITSTKDVYSLCKHLAWHDREHMTVIALDNGNRVLAINEAAIGTVNNVTQSWNLLARVPVMVGATKVILVHNHPGGTTGREGAAKPSKADKKMAKRAVQAFRAVGIQVLDVVVIAADSYSSALPEE